MGIALILLRWPLIGFLVECYGIFILFGECVKPGINGLDSSTHADAFFYRFFKTIASFAYNIPVIGPYLAKGLQVAGDKAGANERAHKDLPV